MGIKLGLSQGKNNRLRVMKRIFGPKREEETGC
jgi:hypothetical protein